MAAEQHAEGGKCALRGEGRWNRGEGGGMEYSGEREDRIGEIEYHRAPVLHTESLQNCLFVVFCNQSAVYNCLGDTSSYLDLNAYVVKVGNTQIIFLLFLDIFFNVVAMAVTCCI